MAVIASLSISFFTEDLSLFLPLPLVVSEVYVLNFKTDQQDYQSYSFPASIPGLSGISRCMRASSSLCTASLSTQPLSSQPSAHSPPQTRSLGQHCVTRGQIPSWQSTAVCGRLPASHVSRSWEDRMAPYRKWHPSTAQKNKQQAPGRRLREEHQRRLEWTCRECGGPCGLPWNPTSLEL